MMTTFLNLLLRLYPREFRDDYGREMTLALADRRRDDPGVLALAATALDLILNAVRVHATLLAQDLRYGWRTLTQQPAFSLAAIGTLALGIGAATAMFTLLHAVLLRPFPFHQPGRVVHITDTNPALRINSFSSSTPNILSWRERSAKFAAITGYQFVDLNLADPRNPERVSALAVLDDFWRVLGQNMIAGRPFLSEESTAGRDRVVILAEDFWRSRYSADPTILGRAIELSGVSRTVIGIAPSDLGFTHDAALFIPIVPDPHPSARGDRRLTALARLRQGVTLAEADAELNAIYTQLGHEFPKGNAGWGVRLLDLDTWLIEPGVRRSLWVLLAAVALLVLIACVNVASLLLARGAARAKEIGIRLSLGASPARLARQLGTESLLLAFLGGAAGLALAYAATRSIIPFLPASLPGLARLDLDPAVLAFAFALTLLASLLFGIGPSWQAARGQHNLATARPRVRPYLVSAQVALATVLMVGALLMITTFRNLTSQNLGFRADHLLTARFSPPPELFENERQAPYFDAILEQVKSLPGVASAGITSEIPMGPVNTGMAIIPTERAATISTDGVRTTWRIVSNSYLDTLGVPLLRGRRWTANENYRARPLLMSQDLARRLWPDGADPLGRRVRLANGLDFTVIGITGDLRHRSLLEDRPTATIYFPTLMGWPTMSIVVRTHGDPAALAPALRQAVRRVNPSQPLFDIRTMEAHVSNVAEAPRLAALLFASFAALALALGIAGAAGLVVYTVARQRRELAIRLAIGASRSRVIRDVAWSHLLHCLAGLALGLAAAWFLRPGIQSLLFGIPLTDPTPFAAAGLLLALAAWLACLLPAIRAARIDPAVTLRTE